MERMTVFLKSEEKDALLSLANKEYRDPRSQAALIIRQDLERRGLLQPCNLAICGAKPGKAEGGRQ